MNDARACGPCTACCDFPAVEILAKPAYELCQHACHKTGCAIYSDRPGACHDYTCLWLDGEFDLGDRPDSVGLAFDLPTLIQDHPDYQGVSVICARETRLGARQEPRAAKLLVQLAGGMVVRLTRWGGKTELLGQQDRIDLLVARATQRRADEA